jgi:chitinase
LDLINVMAYDLHGSWDGVTGQNAPLYPSSVDVSANQKLLTVDAAIRGWIQRGADPQKISLGLGVYGRTYTLTNKNNHKVGSPVSGAGNGGKYTGEAGMLGYNEVTNCVTT